jgi:hypothetical protein
MKQSTIDRISGYGYAFLGCYRGPEGLCFYLCADGQRSTDYGERIERLFLAYAEDESDPAVLRLSISRTALGTARIKELIGDPSTYLDRAGIAHLRSWVSQGARHGEQRQVALDSRSPDEAFALPAGPDPILAQRALRAEILRHLVTLHSQGLRRVAREVLLKHLCSNVGWIDRALSILGTQGYLKGLGTGSYKLSDEGHLEAERTNIEMPGTPQVAPPGAAGPGLEFDCFVSYASEDRTLVKELVKTLTDRELQVWWDKGQITLGDKLTRKLDEGLRVLRYGVVIVSRHFVAKKWTDAEIRALISRSIESDRKVILPVLVDMSHTQFQEAYPIIGDLVTTTFSGDVGALADEILRAVAD